MHIETFRRYEKKYLLPRSALPSFVSEVSRYMLPDKYCIGGERYLIRNIYYDTPAFDVIRASRLKPYYKEKLRIRSYDLLVTGDTPVFLELKKKIGGIVNKRRVKLPLFEAEAAARDITDLNELAKKNCDNYMTHQILGEIGDFSCRHPQLFPASYIEYRRMAFFGIDNPDFRITLDNDIAYNFDLPSFIENQKLIPLLHDDVILMEVKIIGAFPLWLASLLSETEVRKVSLSKYGTAYAMMKTNCNLPLDVYSLDKTISATN